MKKTIIDIYGALHADSGKSSCFKLIFVSLNNF